MERIWALRAQRYHLELNSTELIGTERHCVCACVRACVRACVCVRARARVLLVLQFSSVQNATPAAAFRLRVSQQWRWSCHEITMAESNSGVGLLTQQTYCISPCARDNGTPLMTMSVAADGGRGR